MSEQKPSESSSKIGESLTIEPPTTVRGILGYLGPGLIIAGSIVGSGELIATTKTGAEAGFTLLWLIVIGCVIKVFTQVEFGRYAIVTGKTAMDGLNEVPGPRFRVNWLVWYWLLMFLFGIGQLGGIVGGVGQAMSISVPITGDFKKLVKDQQNWDEVATPIRAKLDLEEADELASRDMDTRKAARSRIDKKLKNQMVGEISDQEQLEGARPSQGNSTTKDDVYWSAAITVITSIMLVVGRYTLVQTFSTVMVASFTLLTIVNLGMLQSHQAWAISVGEIKQGLSMGLPTAAIGSLSSPLATALAAFGIIGVGASELVAYPYWCLEKGYGRFTGPREASEQWGIRARGWLRVLRVDAWCSMFVYTFATIAFYLLGAAVLHRKNLNPEKDQLIFALGEMYVPVFGHAAQMLFLFGAFAVLYSTFFVANAGNARVCSDAVRVFGLRADTPAANRRYTQIFCGVFPFLCLTVYVFVRAPAFLVLISGLAQSIMLPMLGGAALYFRYRRSDSRVIPGKLWDLFLWLSALGLLIAGGWAALTKLFPSLQLIG